MGENFGHSEGLQMSQGGKKLSFKVVVLGAVSVGKTSLSIQYVESNFVQAKATIAAAFHTKSLNINGVRVDLQIWDTAGQEKFRSLTPMYYRECAAALVVYDLTKEDTLETAEYWIKELREKESPYSIILVGNKSDMVKDLGAATEGGRALAEQLGLQYYTASAKTGDGVSDIFQHLVSKLPIEEKTARNASTVNVASSSAPRSSQSSDCNC